MMRKTISKYLNSGRDLSLSGVQLLFAGLCVAGTVMTPHAASASIYLDQTKISVRVGPGTSAGSFNNTFDGGQTINKVIDAPSASSPEYHDQASHVWFTANQVGGGLELLFDFNQEYDISTLHFWNYDAEAYDVDNIAFTFFNNANIQVGALSVTPALGSSPAIYAENIALAAPLNVRYVTAFLTGTNRQVDFQNIGFTAEMSAPAVPEPATWAMMIAGFGMVGGAMRRRGENITSYQH